MNISSQDQIQTILSALERAQWLIRNLSLDKDKKDASTQTSTEDTLNLIYTSESVSSNEIMIYTSSSPLYEEHSQSVDLFLPLNQRSHEPSIPSWNSTIYSQEDSIIWLSPDSPDEMHL